MTAPVPITLTIVYPQPITPGLPNQGAAYNANLAATNDAVAQLLQALHDYSALPVVRTINDVEPDADGDVVIPRTVVFEAMSTVQRDALTGTQLVIGRAIYNTTRRTVDVYGNNGWQSTGQDASTALTITRVAGVPVQAVETRPDGSQRLMVLRFANDRLVAVQRYNPLATDTLTYSSSGHFTGYTTA